MYNADLFERYGRKFTETKIVDLVELMYRRVIGMKKKFAAKLKPWRINLLIYLAHAGWQLVKKYVKECFKLSKVVGYLTFLDLLDNLVPSSLDIYATLFRGNHFEEC